MAETIQRFFHPGDVDEMLDVMLPRFTGDDINSVVATQAFLVHFMPMSHPQKWLPVCERAAQIDYVKRVRD
jgi:proteasome activator subunit 4